MKKDSLFTSDCCAGFATKLKGGCEMFRGSLINRLTRAVPLVLLVVAIGHLTAARVYGQAAQPTHQTILNSVGAVQTTVNSVETKVDTMSTTINSIETKVDNINAKLDLIPPAWSQILPAADRFQLVMGGAAVLDKETGLVWHQMPFAFLETWYNALSSCTVSTIGGRWGWRLPGVQELLSLIDMTIAPPGPRLPLGHPFSNVQASAYWSTTTSANNTMQAWAVYLDAGGPNTDGKAGTHYVWCVRGGQGVDPQ